MHKAMPTCRKHILISATYMESCSLTDIVIYNLFSFHTATFMLVKHPNIVLSVRLSFD